MRYRLTSRRPLLPALGVCVLLARTASGQTPAPRLDGRWTLNLELSDQLEEKLQDAIRLGAFTIRGTRGTSGSGSGAGKDQVDDRELLAALRPPLLLVIRQDDSTVAISDAAGFMVSHPADGRKVKEYLLSGETLEVSTKWKDEMLIIERKQERAGSVRETFAIDKGRDQLVVTVRLHAASLPRVLAFRRVYDRAPGG